MASNQHRNLTGEQLHNPKGFDGASPSTTLIKNAAGEIEWRDNTTFDNALDYVSPQSAPPTEVEDDIYLLDDTGVVYDIDTIAWQSGNTIRYTFNGTPNLSAITAGDYLVTSGNGNSSNDGTFVISAVNDGSDYIEITNALRSDATDDEASDAVGTAYYTLEEWDGASKGSHIKFDGTNWNSVNAQDGALCYDETSSSHRIYNATSTNWDLSLTTASGAGAAQISGTPVDNQIAVWTNSTTLEGDANLTWDAGLDMTATSLRAIDLTHNPSGTGTAIGHDMDLTGNANTTIAYGFYSKVDTSLGGSAYGGWFRVLGSDGAAFGSYGSVEGSVGGAAYGAYNVVGIGGTDTSGGTMYGSQNVITISTSGTHGASMIGSSVDLNYNKVGGSLTNAFGFYSTGIVCNDSAATIDNAYGIYLGDNAGSGTITDSWGVYQDGADDKNYFGGQLQLNHTSGTAGQFLKAIDVDGNAQWDDAVTATSGSANQIAVFDGANSIDGDANFIWNNYLEVTSSAVDAVSVIHTASNTTNIAVDATVTTGASAANSYGHRAIVNAAAGGSGIGGFFQTSQTASTKSAIGVYGKAGGGGDLGGASYGGFHFVEVSGTDSSGGTIHGSKAQVTINTTGTHTSTVYGVASDINYDKTGGTLGTAVGFYHSGAVVNTGTITDAYGIYLGDNTGTGTITNSYGVFQVGSDDHNYFAGNVGIGETSPQVKLHASGSGEIARLETSAGTGDNYFTFHDTAQKGLLGYESGSDDLIIENGEEGSSIIFKTAHNGGAGTTYTGLELDGEGDTTVYGTLICNSDATARQFYTDVTTFSPTGASPTVSPNFNNDGSVIVIDCSGVTSGNVTIDLSSASSNAGASYLFKLIQGSNSTSIVFPSSVKFAGETAPYTHALTTASGSIDVVAMTCISDSGTVEYLGNVSENYG